MRSKPGPLAGTLSPIEAVSSVESHGVIRAAP